MGASDDGRKEAVEREGAFDDRWLAAVVFALAGLLLLVTLPLATNDSRPTLVRTGPAAAPAGVNQ